MSNLKNTLTTKRFVIRKSLIGKNTVITFVNKSSRVSSTCFLEKYEQVQCSNGFCEFDSHTTTNV